MDIEELNFHATVIFNVKPISEETGPKDSSTAS